MSEDIATLGLGVDSTQVKEAKKSLDQLSEAGARTEKSLDSLLSSNKNLSESAKQSAQEAERYTSNLKRQADTLGMTSSQLRRYETDQQKFNDAQRASVEASNRAIDSYERQQAALSNLKMIAIGAGTAIGVALVAGLKASVTLAAEAEQSHLRLAAVLRGTGHAAGLTKSDLDGMADSMKEKLGIDDDALRDSMAILLTFRNISKDSFGEALEVSADLAAVMQTDLKSAVMQLGKALEDPDQGLTALKRSGVSFTETQKDMIKGMVDAGNQAEAITLILKTMKEQGLDGVAEAMNSGVTKAIRDTGLAWDDFMKALGNTSAVKDVTEGFFSGLSGSLKDLRQAVESGDWMDRLVLFATGVKTPSLIAKTNASAAIPDDQQARAIADEGLARQKANQEAELAAIAKKKADEEAAKAAEEASKRAIAAAKAREEADKRAAQQAVDGSNRIIAALALETEQVGKSVGQKRLLAAATEAAKAPTKELAMEIMASAQAYAMATQKEEEFKQAEKDRLETIKEIAKAEKEAARESEKAAKESAQQWNNMWSGVEQTAKTSFIQFAAHGTGAMKSIGEAIKLSIIDVLYQLTVRKWMINIGASLESTFLNTAVSGGGGVLGGASSMFNMASSGIKGLSGLLGGGSSGIFSNAGGAGTAFIGGPGTALGGTGMGGMSSLMSMAGPVAGAAAALMASVGIGSMIAGDKKVLGMGGTTTALIGAALGGPIGAVVAGAINALFGRGPMKQQGTLLEGQIGSEGFESGMLQTRFKAKGGLLRSDKIDYSRVDAITGETFTDNGKLAAYTEELAKASKAIFGPINEATKQTNAALRGVADNLGLATGGMDDFSYSLKILTEKGKMITGEQISEEIAKISDGLAKSLLPGVEEFQKSGETTANTLVRLSNEFSVLTGAAGLLFDKSSGWAQDFVKQFGFADRSAFLEKAGGANAFAGNVAGFAQNFLTEDQRMKPVIESLLSERDKLGLSGINTRNQYTSAVQSGNLNPDQLIFLLQNQDTINQVFGYLEKKLAEINPVINETSMTFGDAAVKIKEANSIVMSAESARGQADELYGKSISEATQEIARLQGIAAQLRGTVSSINPMSIDQARSQIMNGGLDSSNLGDSLSALSGMGTAGFSNVLDFKRAKGANTAAINALQNVADKDIMTATRRLNELNSQKESFQQALLASVTAMTLALNKSNRRDDKWDTEGMPPVRAA